MVAVIMREDERVLGVLRFLEIGTAKSIDVKPRTARYIVADCGSIHSFCIAMQDVGMEKDYEESSMRSNFPARLRQSFD